MDRHLKAYLFDIQTAIDEIYSFCDIVPKRFEEYERNLMLRRAIERNVAIIGEAVNRMVKEYPEVQITNARAIIATRNRVIHAYDAVTDDIMWKIVINDLPRLKDEVFSLMSEE